MILMKYAHRCMWCGVVWNEESWFDCTNSYKWREDALGEFFHVVRFLCGIKWAGLSWINKCCSCSNMLPYSSNWRTWAWYLIRLCGEYGEFFRDNEPKIIGSCGMIVSAAGGGWVGKHYHQTFMGRCYLDNFYGKL